MIPIVDDFLMGDGQLSVGYGVCRSTGAVKDGLVVGEKQGWRVAGKGMFGGKEERLKNC